jgi:cytidine deaminase
MSEVTDRLVAAAKEATARAYAPYSNFQVGASLLLDDGTIVTGANLENASYGMSLCAETVAIAKASSEGQLCQIVAIAVAGGAEGRIGAAAITPCGRCRQVIKEVADLTGRDLPIYCAKRGGYDTHLISDLLPYGFGPASLRA